MALEKGGTVSTLHSNVRDETHASRGIGTVPVRLVITSNIKITLLPLCPPNSPWPRSTYTTLLSNRTGTIPWEPMKFTIIITIHSIRRWWMTRPLTRTASRLIVISNIYPQQGIIRTSIIALLNYSNVQRVYHLVKS